MKWIVLKTTGSFSFYLFSKSILMHIGKMIQDEFNHLPKNQSVVWLARQLCCDRRNVYDIFHRENIDIELLLRISRVLHHDFFSDISGSLQNEDPA